MRFDELPISEADLLAWVEGDLSPERRREVDRALAADPHIRRALEGMAADRTALIAMGHERLQAPTGMVARALDIAQREALVGVDGTDPVVGRIGRAAPMLRRRFAVAAAFVAAFAGAYAVREGAFSRSSKLRAKAPIEANDALAMMTDSHAPLEAPAAAAPSTALAMAAPAQPAALPAAGLAEDQTPATREQIASMIPLSRVMNAMDASGMDLSQQLMTVEVLEGQPRPVSRDRLAEVSRVSPASYSDALTLAGLNRLNVRVQAKDPSSVERVIRSYCERMNRDVRLKSQTNSDGSICYAIETDRDESELDLLVAAIRNACEECGRRTFFDVPLSPAACVQGGALTTTPAQTSGRTARVSLPVVIERISE